MLGPQATEEKSNEITAIPLLLKHLDLKGALVIMDAIYGMLTYYIDARATAEIP